MHLRWLGAVIDPRQTERPTVRALPVEDDHAPASGEHLHGDRLGEHALTRARSRAHGDVGRVVAQGQGHRPVACALPEIELPLGQAGEVRGHLVDADPSGGRLRTVQVTVTRGPT